MRECIIIILFLSLQSSICLAQEATSNSIQGIWINQRYAKLLETSFSPKAAFSVSEFSSIHIDHNRIVLFPSYHETIEYMIESYSKKSGKFLLKNCELIDSMNINSGKLTISFHDRDQMIQSSFFKLPAKFKTENEFFNSLFLVGKYKDKENRIYIFENDTVDWNGSRKKYKVFFDYVEFFPMSTLCIIDNAGRCTTGYGFVTNGSMLQLYEYDNDYKTIKKLSLDLLKE